MEQYFYESGNINIAQSTLATCKMHTHEPRIDESKENDWDEQSRGNKNTGYMYRKWKQITENCLKASTTGDNPGIMFS